MADGKFIQTAIKRPGALRRKMGVKKGETIPTVKISKAIGRLQKQAKGERKLPPAKLRTLRQLLLARKLKQMHGERASA